MVEVTCDKCGTPHRFDDADVPPSGKVVACKSCGTSVTVMPPSAAAMGMNTPARKSTVSGVGSGKLPAEPPPVPPGSGDTGDVIDLAPSGALGDVPKPQRRSPLADVSHIPSQRRARSSLEDAVLDLPAPEDDDPEPLDLDAPGDVGVSDLPAPKDEGQVDLPAPAETGGRFDDAVDLPAPTEQGISDLPAPTEQGLSDLPAPKDPGLSDLPAPRDPGLSDLPAPRDPDVSDLPAPRADSDGDLPRPVGPTSSKSSDLPAPKGFFDDVPAPRGGATGDPQSGGDLPAPKGFFDDVPAPSADPGTASAAEGLFDDLPAPRGEAGGGLDLDLAPASGSSGAEPLDLSSEAEPLDLSSEAHSFDLSPDSEPLELEPETSGGKSGLFNLDGDLHLEPSPNEPGGAPELELDSPAAGGAPDLELDSPAAGGTPDLELDSPAAGGAQPLDLGDDDAGVVTFKKGPAAAKPGEEPSLELARPTASPKARPPQDDTALELDSDAAQELQRRTSTAAADRRAEREAADSARKKKKTRRQRLVAVAALAVVGVGAGGFFGYQKWQEQKREAAQLERTLEKARSALRSSNDGHWDEAARFAERALATAPDDPEAVGLATQAYYAGLLAEGTGHEQRRNQGDELIQRITDESLQGPEVAKAEALRAVIDGLPERAVEHLDTVLRRDANDPDALLYLGWAHAANEAWPAAAEAFERAADAAQNRKTPALYGLGRAQLAMGDDEAAYQSFQRILVDLGKEEHLGARVGLVQAKQTERFSERETELLGILRTVGENDGDEYDQRAVSLAWSLAGDEALRAGRIDEAQRRYGKALERDPANVDAVIGKAKAALHQNQLEGAREELQKVLATSPDDIDATLTLAEVAAAQGQSTEAQTLAEAVVEGEAPHITDADRARAHMIRGDVRAEDETLAEEAIADYQKARELADGGETDIAATIALARMYTEQADRAATEAARERASERALELLEPLEERAEDDPALAVTLGITYLSAGDGKTAETWFRKARENRPDDIEARFQLGEALLAQDRTDEAVETMKAAYEADEGREDIGLRLALVYEQLEEDEEAGAMYARLLEGARPSVNVLARAGRFYARTGEPERAGEIGEQLLAEQPNHPTGLYLRGEGAFGRGDHASALQDFQQAVALEQAAQYLDALGRAYEALKRPADAMRAYSQANEQDPAFLNPLMGRARVHLMRTEYDKAIDLLERAAELDEATAAERAEIYFNLGRAHQRKGDAREAVDHYRTSLRHDGDAAETHYRLGEAYYDLNRLGQAAAALTAATRRADDDAEWLMEAWRKLGYTQRERNARDAIRAFEQYLAHDPGGAEAKDAKKELRWLKENIRR